MRTPRPAEPWDPAHPPHSADVDARGDVARPAPSPASKPIPIVGIRPHV